MVQHATLQTAANRQPFRGLAGYRVVAKHRDYRVSLVRLAESSLQAAHQARAAGDTLRFGDDRHDIVAFRTEEWVGTLTAGEWRPTSRWQNVRWHKFAGEKPVNGEANPSLPRTGDTIECELLGVKTRKGGWRAKLRTRGMEGPVTNSADVPATAQAGQIVKLRVGTISQDGQRIQFHWPSNGKSNGR